MRLRILFITILILGLEGFLVFGEIRSVTTPVDFLQVGQGEMLLRDKNDRVYSAVIMSYEGFENFKKQYPIKFELNEKGFKDSFYIIGFSDNYWGIAADGFKHQSQASSYYYLDLADTGLKIKALPPPEGKKYTAYAIIKVSDEIVDRHKISHIQVREGVNNGLTNWC